MKLKTILRKLYLTGREIALSPFIRKPVEIPSDFLKNCRHVLVFTMDRLGDLMCSFPALKSLRLALPHAAITVCSPPYVKDLLCAQPEIDDWCSIENLSKNNQEKHFDLVIDFSTDYPLQKAFTAFQTEACVRIGYNISGRGVFFTHPLPCEREKTHTVDLLANLLTPLGIDTADRIPHLTVTEQWHDEFLKTIKNFNIGQRQIVSIHPGGTYPTQRWPSERYAEIADKLTESGFFPLLLGGPGDAPVCREISQAMKTVPINCCSQFSMGALAAAIKASRLLICNNSGPLHLAVAIGTPTVSTMGPTLPETWWPLGPGHRVIRHDLSCSPCNEGYCRIKTHECLKSISMAEMWHEIQLSLQKVGSDPATP